VSNSGSDFQLAGLSSATKVILCALVACTVQAPPEGIGPQPKPLPGQPAVHQTVDPFPEQPELPTPRNPSGPRVPGGTPAPMPPNAPKGVVPWGSIIMDFLSRFPLVIFPGQTLPPAKPGDKLIA